MSKADSASADLWLPAGAVSSVAMVIGAFLARAAPGGGEYEVLQALGVGDTWGRARWAATLGSLLVYAGVAGLCVAWVGVGALVHRRAVTPSVLRRAAVLWGGPLLLAPALFSHDLHSYIAQGSLVLAHLNPYHHGPAALGPGSSIAHAVDPVWRRARTPYGPVALALSAVVVWVIRPLGAMALTVAVRLLAVVGLGLAARSIPRLARAHGVPETFALWVAILNPLTLMHLVAGGHNDALMIGLLLAGLAFDAEDRPATALVCCALAGLVKAPALAGAAFVTLGRARRAAPGRARTHAILLSVATVTATIVVVTLASGLGLGWIGALATPGRVRVLITPTNLVSVALTDLAHLLGIAVSGAAVLRGVRLVGFLGAAFVLVRLLVRPDTSPARTTGYALLALVLLGPVIQPWYLLWPVFILGACGSERVRRLFVVPSVLLCFVVGPIGHPLPDWFVVAIVAAVVVALAVTSRTSARRTPRLPV